MRFPRRVSTLAVLAALAVAPLGCSGTSGAATAGDPGIDPVTPTTALRADHTTLDAATIPSVALDAARALSMHLRHASVGANIWGGLTALASEDSTRYALPSWTQYSRGNPSWQTKLSEFAAFVDANAASYAVFQTKFCYIDQAATFTAYRDAMLGIEAAHPTKRIIWWTMPLEIGGTNNGLRAAFNQQVRAYCAANGKALFDIADIESHDLAGHAVTSGGHEALDTAWASDTAGHLNADGSKRAAKAMWWLMARIAGWSGP